MMRPRLTDMDRVGQEKIGFTQRRQAAKNLPLRAFAPLREISLPGGRGSALRAVMSNQRAALCAMAAICSSIRVAGGGQDAFSKHAKRAN